MEEENKEKCYFESEMTKISSVAGSRALARSCLDCFDFALKLRSGDVIRYSTARLINDEWIHLDVQDEEDQPKFNKLPYPARRGIDVRISDIVWVMDAPYGS